MARRTLPLLLLTLVILGRPALAEPQKYYVPPSQFNAAFQIMDRGFSNIMGLFKGATGSFAFDEGTKTLSHLRLAIEAGSLMTANGVHDRDLMQLLSVRQYPEISFAALAETKLNEGKGEIKGTLTLHGVSKPATFEATLNQVGQATQRGPLWASQTQTVGLSLKGSFKRADFGMGDAPETEGRFGETLTFMIEMQAIQQ
ncbi:MAG: YceI family protein [Alphaproteobacteria bacterium]|nr:YceI family protein [Alphaproteobacteria bacterium]